MKKTPEISPFLEHKDLLSLENLNNKSVQTKMYSFVISIDTGKIIIIVCSNRCISVKKGPTIVELKVKNLPEGVILTLQNFLNCNSIICCKQFFCSICTFLLSPPPSNKKSIILTETKLHNIVILFNNKILS